MKAKENVLKKEIEHFNNLLESNNINELKQDLPLLLKNYKKLSKRIDVITKQGDRGLREFIFQNEKLRKFTQKKILEGSTSIRHVKDELSELSHQYKVEIENYNLIKEELFSQKKRNEEIENNLNIMTEEYEILKETNISFEHLLELEIFKAKYKKSNLFYAMIILDDFKNIKLNIKHCTTISNFILEVIKYLKECLPENTKIMYHNSGIFNILISDIKINNTEVIFQKIGKRKRIHGVEITLHTIGTALRTNDSIITIQNRSLKLFSQLLSNKNRESSIIIIN